MVYSLLEYDRKWDIYNYKEDCIYEKTIAFIGMTVLLAVFSTVGAAQITAEDSTAATITSPDGILSIEMPGEEWKI